MSLKRPAKHQPENFEFNSSSIEAANKIVSNYPEGKQQSAVMALLYIAQKQNNNCTISKTTITGQQTYPKGV